MFIGNHVIEIFDIAVRNAEFIKKRMFLLAVLSVFNKWHRKYKSIDSNLATLIWNRAPQYPSLRPFSLAARLHNVPHDCGKLSAFSRTALSFTIALPLRRRRCYGNAPVVYLTISPRCNKWDTTVRTTANRTEPTEPVVCVLCSCLLCRRAWLTLRTRHGAKIIRAR